MQPVGHNLFQNAEYDVARAMTGMEHGLGIIVRQPLSEADQVVSRLMAVQQVEPAHDRTDRPGTCRQDVLQTTMGATCEKQPVCMESQLMPEIIGYKNPFCILDEQMTVSLGHGMCLRNMCHNMDAIGDLTGVVHHDEPLPYFLRPHRGDAVHAISHGIELPVDCLRGNDDFRFFVEFQEMAQSSRMVAVTMGDKDVIHRPEVNAHPLRVQDEHITGSGVKQDFMSPGF